MNRPDKPGELSIDEILASIRQNTSEAPAEAVRSGPDATPDETAPATQSSGVGPPPPPQAPAALLDRLNGVLKTGPQAGGGANGSKRPLSFDQDLADMLDEPPATGGAGAAPKPEMRVPPELGSLGGTSPPARDASGEATPPSAPSLPPHFAPSAPLVPPPPFGRSDDGGGASLRPQSFGFPPLTKRAGFYPPQRSEPVLPPVRGEPGTARAESAPTPASSVPGADAAAPRPPDFGSLVPGDVGAGGVPPPDSSFGVPPRAAADGSLGEVPNSLARVLPELDAAAPSPTTATAPLATPAASHIPSLSTPPDPMPAAQSDAPAHAAAGAARASGGTPSPAAPSEKAAAAVEDDQDAATQALDALAQGLAAASAKSEPPAVALKPVQATAGDFEANARPAAASAVPVAPAHGEAPARTLEDAVADMLRPMLQQWVQENMPRIMEKALRVEMAKTLGSGTKPPGS